MTQHAETQNIRLAGVLTVTEVERKYDIGPGFLLPDLSDLIRGGFIGEAELQDLDATYHDTLDRRLLAEGITLRRRSGGTDAGWHLKLPKAPGVRTEVRLPADGRRQVPRALAARVRQYTCGLELHAMARLQTERTLYTVWNAEGRPLAELAMDQVTATVSRLDGHVTATWCELEVELVDGDDQLLTQIGDRLEEAGATPSRYPSKLSRALG